MIEISSITKKFGSDITALDSISFNISKGSIFGLVGSNGAGKSTLLRIISGVFEATGGTVSIDGMACFENPEVKEKIFFISDFPYFFNDSNIENMAWFYKRLYKNWDEVKYMRLSSMFPINTKSRIINMSKGMQRQAALILALSTNPDYLLLDEIFDGLDPVVRQLLKKLLVDEVASRDMTVLIASHNLRELEDVCDHVGFLHKGGILMESDIDELKIGIRKVQLAFKENPGEDFLSGFNIIKQERRGSVYSLVVKGDCEAFMSKMQSLNPVLFEALPLTLEEVFISEMEAAGYDINCII